MAERAIQNDTYIIDPMFFIPEGVRDYAYEEDALDALDNDESDTVVGIFDDEESVPDIFIVNESGTDFDEEVPDVPGSLLVVSQIIRTMMDGTQVVDLIVDVEDIPDISKYDFRVVKI